VFSAGVDPRLYDEDYSPDGRIIDGVSLDGSRRRLRRDGKKRITLCKEEFMCAVVTMRLV
jgi:hypothetical protein